MIKWPSETSSLRVHTRAAQIVESFHSGWDYIPLGVPHIFHKPHIADPLSYKRRSRKEVPVRGVLVIVVLVVLLGKWW